jgi:hypothetical protein
MLRKTISQTFLPAIATMLCACAPAQAANFHFGFTIPVGRPLVRPVYPVCPVPVYVAPRVVHHTVHYSAADTLIHEIQHDLNDIETLLYKSPYTELHQLSRCIKNNWRSWVSNYRRAFGLNRHELEALSDELRDIRFVLRRVRNTTVQLCHYEYSQVLTALADIADILTSYRIRTSDVRDITMYLSQIQRILATV